MAQPDSMAISEIAFTGTLVTGRRIMLHKRNSASLSPNLTVEQPSA
jgi:hypothetical protein